METTDIITDISDTELAEQTVHTEISVESSPSAGDATPIAVSILLAPFLVIIFLIAAIMVIVLKRK